jgi:hypothetical protein
VKVTAVFHAPRGKPPPQIRRYHRKDNKRQNACGARGKWKFMHDEILKGNPTNGSNKLPKV